MKEKFKRGPDIKYNKSINSAEKIAKAPICYDCGAIKPSHKDDCKLCEERMKALRIKVLPKWQ